MNAQEILAKLQQGLDAGFITGWRLTRVDPWSHPALVPTTTNDEHTGVYFRPLRGRRVQASASFPAFEGYDCGRRLLESPGITLSLDRSTRAFVRDLDRRLLTPFLAALPEAVALCQGYLAEADEQKALYAGLRSRMPGDAIAFDRDFKLRGTYRRFRGQAHSTNVKVEVRRANNHSRYGYPASVDIELRGLPPAIAAAVLDLLGEESTS